MTLSPAIRKSHGAFYTPSAVADFLTRWAIRAPTDIVLDPSAGDGVFLFAAAKHLQALGGTGSKQVIGIELREDAADAISHEAASRRSPITVHRADFFTVKPGGVPLADAVIGNPPFIRYQKFSGDLRERALSCAREAGVQLSALTSSWAPFLVHATQFIRPGGRLGVVAPAELAHAGYAQPLIKHICGSFREVSLITFDKRLFPDLGEDTVLLMCEGRGEPFHGFTLTRLADMSSLGVPVEAKSSVVMDAPAMSTGAIRMLQYLLPSATRELYERLESHPRIMRLGQIADVGIGYVTGANDFFHLSEEEAKRSQIARRFLKPAVRRGAEFKGLQFIQADWRSARAADQKNALLCLKPQGELSGPVEKYLRKGRREGVAAAYKCRTRKPWYAVPHVHVGDAFLTYMSGDEPRLVVNDAGVVAPNTLHVVKMRQVSPINAWDLAAVWQSSLVKLSCELSGHSLGGGMLKLEPSEAQNLIIPMVKFEDATVRRLDTVGREGKWTRVVSEVDARVRSELGLTAIDIQALREAVVFLKDRRTRR
jgi:adenine-specific DNA-methyltransferase